jgi:hypothetical protein
MHSPSLDENPGTGLVAAKVHDNETGNTLPAPDDGNLFDAGTQVSPFHSNGNHINLP